MANELKLFANPNTQSGLTVTADVYTDLGVSVGGSISCSEVGSLAIYLGDMPTTGAGRYIVRFFDGGALLSQSIIDWDGEQEIIGGLTDIDGYTQIEAQRIMLSVLAGKVRGAQTGTEIFRDASDVKDRVTAQVDSSGNRTVVNLDAT